MQNTGTARKRKRRRIEEVVSYAVGHRIRIEILALLNEGEHTAEQLAKAVGERVNKVGHHIKELHEDGAIELAKVEPVRNALQHYYRAIQIPYYSDEEIADMTAEQRKMLIGLALQSIVAESLSSFWAGKMHDDPRVWLAWRWFNVDKQGREDIADELARSWSRVQDIEAESNERRSVSGEEAITLIVSSLGYERGNPTLAQHSLPAFSDRDK